VNFIVAHLASPSGTQGDAGGLALILLISLLVALLAYAIGRHIWHCPYRAVLLAGSTAGGMIYLLFSISDHVVITI
jgi:hypothetical protein